MSKTTFGVFLRDKRLNRNRFNRQFVIGPYIVDFVCRKQKLIIELDGSQHLEANEYDNERTKYLTAKGYRVLRFWNNEVLNNLKDVLDLIVYKLRPSPALRAPSPAKRARDKICEFF